MSLRKRYKKRSKFNVTAVKMDLDFDGFVFQKWGAEQKCQPGDWLVNNNGDVYTIDKDYFKDYYQIVSQGVYEKVGEIWAEQAKQDGTIKTKEGHTNYLAGDYLVFDREQDGEGYAIKKPVFERMYELLDSVLELSVAQKSYLDERLSGAIQWYDKSAGRNKYYFYSGQTIAIVTAAAVPIFSGFSPGDGDWIKWLIAILGGASAVVAGLLSLFNWQQNWVKYRAAAEDLKSHFAQFQAGTGIYNEPKKAFEILADNCERILAVERGSWIEQTSKIGQSDDK